MSEVVERAARLIDPDAFDSLPGHEESRCHDCDTSRDAARQIIRKIIKAMREPTASMIDAVDLSSGESSEDTISRAWKAMIDEILKD